VKHFHTAFIYTAISLLLAGFVGYFLGGQSSVAIVGAVATCAVLGIMEVSLSFDNAVVNAARLEDMSDVWRHRFITWGVLIAVFGMRLLFPLLILSIAAGLGPVASITLAIQHPDQYHAILAHAKPEIMAFGGTFLAMVALKYFFDIEKDVHWVSFIESRLTQFGALESIEVVFVAAALVIASLFASAPFIVLLSGVLGLVTFILVKALSAKLEAGSVVTSVAKAGIGAFVYLEIMDASFSFDGVIGAFALSTNLFIIALGLGIGAMFVRSMTLFLVERKTLTEYRFLENGAFWAILILAGIMFASISYEIPEVITGLIGAGLIITALVSSIVWNKRNSATT